jgi:integrase/recombinase XerD
MRRVKKQVRIIKKVRVSSGVWKFVSLEKAGNRYLWDERHGYYFVEWWEGAKRKREVAGITPAEANEAQRRKRNELIGNLLSNGQGPLQSAAEREKLTPIADARELFINSVKAHSPDKPETVRRYEQVLDHFVRILGHKKYIEAIERADIDTYKIKRSTEKSLRHDRLITPRTINFEVSTLRTFFYYLENERGLKLKNPCSKFKHLKDQKKKAKSKPPVYTQDELDRIFAKCGEYEKAIFATLLLSGIRKRELYFLAWSDLDLKVGTLKVTGDGKAGFSPKDYEERMIPIPPDLVFLLEKLPRKSRWVFCSSTGTNLSHLLRKLKSIADRAGVMNATLHKFRHTYATRLLESGCDIVTVQHLMGHSDIETTRQYLSPNDELKRRAADRLTLTKIDLK